MPIDPSAIRQQFACFREPNPLRYFDSAATAQVPDVVLEKMNDYYTSYKANVHRGVHAHADKATNAYEHARSTVQNFLNAPAASSVIFTKNCTEAINLAAWSWAYSHLEKGDIILLSICEHHSNIVPWQQLQKQKQIEIRWWENLDEEPDLHNVKLVAVTGQSNVTGWQPNLHELIPKAHAAGAKVLVDAAQLAAHHRIDVQELDCDFLAFSGHKLYGPTGIGVLYAKPERIAEMQPWLGGGGMINRVTKDGFTPADPPQKFEAGTPPIAEEIGLAAAINWLNQYSWQEIESYENELASYAKEQLSTIPQLSTLHSPLSTPSTFDLRPSTPLSFTIQDLHPHDLTDLLGQKNIHLRAGNHCTMPLHQHLGIPASTRLSLALYNTKEEIDELRRAIVEAQEILGNN